MNISSANGSISDYVADGAIIGLFEDNKEFQEVLVKSEKYTPLVVLNRKG